jgi:type I restriction enzyme S subunit
MSLMRIDDLFHFEKGSLQSSKCTAGEFDFITASSEWKTHNEYTHNCEALVFAAAASGSLGRTHYVNGKFIASDLCFIITPKNQNELPIDLKFYHMIFNEIKDDIVKNTKAGTSKEAIGLKAFGNYKLPYFDIDKQVEAKIQFVNMQESKVELNIELTHQLDLIKKLRQAFLREAMQGKLITNDKLRITNGETGHELLAKIKAEKAQLIAEKKLKKEKELPPITEDEIPFEIPEHWTWCRLGETGELKRGKSKHRPRNDENLFINGKYPFIQTGDVARSKNTNYIINTINGYYNDFGLAQSQIQKKGTLCITIAANIAECGFLGFDACTPDSIVNYISIDKVIEKYVFYYLIDAKDEIEKYAPATAQKNINLGILNDLKIPLPPLHEQEQIVAKLEKLLAFCDGLEQSIKESQGYNEKLLQQVLREALQGNE